MTGVGMLGAGFIAEGYVEALEDVRHAELVAVFSRDQDRAVRLAGRWSPNAATFGTMAALCANPRVDIVIIALPNEVHLDAVRAAAEAGKAVICTKPLARTANEAAEILRIVRDAGVWHGYAESSVFSPNVAKAHQIVAAGSIGRLTTMRAREAHSGPHAPHFWDAETAGGGAFLDMGCHTVESAREFFGKDDRVTEVLAWGATLVHGDKTSGEDTAIALLQFASGRLATLEASWAEKGGMQLRHEFVGDAGRLVTDFGRHARLGLHRAPRRLPRGEGRCRYRLGLPGGRGGPRLWLLADVPALHQTVRGWATPIRDLRGRLCRQLHHRRGIPFDGRPCLGAGDGRPSRAWQLRSHVRARAAWCAR